MSKKKLPLSVKLHIIFWSLFMPVSLILSIWWFWPDANKDDDMKINSAVTLQAPYQHS